MYSHALGHRRLRGGERLAAGADDRAADVEPVLLGRQAGAHGQARLRVEHRGPALLAPRRQPARHPLRIAGRAQLGPGDWRAAGQLATPMVNAVNRANWASCTVRRRR